MSSWATTTKRERRGKRIKQELGETHAVVATSSSGHPCRSGSTYWGSGLVSGQLGIKWSRFKTLSTTPPRLARPPTRPGRTGLKISPKIIELAQELVLLAWNRGRWFLIPKRLIIYNVFMISFNYLSYKWDWNPKDMRTMVVVRLFELIGIIWDWNWVIPRIVMDSAVRKEFELGIKSVNLQSVLSCWWCFITYKS